MDKQIIITIGREFGSGGLEIAEKLSARLGIPVYDKEYFTQHLKDDRIIERNQVLFDESSPLTMPSVSMIGSDWFDRQGKIDYAEFNYIKKEADAGKSFIVVGRCAEYVLKDHPARVSFFILGDPDIKAARIAEMYNLSDQKAHTACKNMDKTRKAYHNFYSTVKWGDSRAYDLCINSSRVGIDNAVGIIENYIKVWKQ
ncbi:MAG: cytidylate kinase-like family protein [Clostridiales bacterium]|nr:cytidylate kinase-like family protein [Clostridiales bacterium]